MNESSSDTKSDGVGIILSGSECMLSDQDFQDIDVKQEVTKGEIIELPDSGDEASALSASSPIVSKQDGQLESTDQYILVPVGGEASSIKCNCLVSKILEQNVIQDLSLLINFIKKDKPRPEVTTWSNQWSKQGGKILNYIQWLTGCNEMKALFCWPCLLFQTKKSEWNSSGVSEYEKFFSKWKCHENEVSHIQATMQYAVFVNNHIATPKKNNSELRRRKVAMNRKALKIVLEVTGLLIFPDQLIDTIKLLRIAKKDDNIALQGVSNLHLDLLTSLHHGLKDYIESEISDAEFLSMEVDQVKNDLMSITFRFSNRESGEIVDRFIDFFPIETNEATKIISDTIKNYKLQKCCRVITVGNFPNSMALQEYEDYIILHSPNHKLSQVLPTVLTNIKECATFFLHMDGLKAWILKSSADMKKYIPYVPLECWSDKLLESVLEHKHEIFKLIKTKCDNLDSFDGELYTIGMGILRASKDAEFLFLLAVFGEIFPAVDALQEMVFNHIRDINMCVDTVKEYIKMLNWKKEKFEEIWESIEEEGCEEFGQGPNKRPRYMRSEKLLIYYKQIFNSIIDNVINEVNIRFNDLIYLQIASLIDFNCEDISGKIETISNSPAKGPMMQSLNTIRLSSELLATSMELDFREKSIDELLRYMYSMGLDSPLRETTKLCRLLSVLPYVSQGDISESIKLCKNIKSVASNIHSDIPYHLKIHSDILQKLTDSDEYLEKMINIFSAKNPSIEL